MGIKRIVKNNIYLLKISMHYAPDLLIFTILENIVLGILSVITTLIFTKRIYSLLEDGNDYISIISLILAMAFIFLVVWAFDKWFSYRFLPIKKEKLHQNLQNDLFHKAIRTDIECYDNPQFYNEFIWSIQEADARVCSVVNNIGTLIYKMIYCFAVSGILLKINVVIAIIIFAAVTVAVILNIIRIKIGYKRDKEIRTIQRKIDYIAKVFYSYDYAKEIRTSEVSDLLIDDLDGSMSILNKITYKYGKKLATINFLMRFTTAILFDVVVVMYFAYKLMVEESIAISDFAVLINIIWQLFFNINGIIDCITRMGKDGVYANKVRTFLESTPEIVDSNDAIDIGDRTGDLEIRHMSFTYKGNTEASLKDINMIIKEGEKVAIVGYNGAGKTTLIKLLTRLYEPTAGEIRYCGYDIKRYRVDSFRKCLGCVFQDFRLFAISIAQNVVMEKEYDENVVRQALKKSNYDFEGKGIDIDQVISKEFDNNGVICSGGEAQKIAIARTFAKDFKIIILDEPTSALDPLVEHEINDRVLKETGNKTIIFISHRLSTVRQADKIYLFEEGRIVESGSHDELMKLNRKYATMFRVQAKKYKRPVNQFIEL